MFLMCSAAYIDPGTIVKALATGLKT